MRPYDSLDDLAFDTVTLRATPLEALLALALRLAVSWWALWERWWRLTCAIA